MGVLRPVGIWGHLQGENIKSYNLFSPVMMITWWMKPGGNRPPRDNPLLFSISGTGSWEGSLLVYQNSTCSLQPGDFWHSFYSRRILHLWWGTLGLPRRWLTHHVCIHLSMATVVWCPYRLDAQRYSNSSAHKKLRILPYQFTFKLYGFICTTAKLRTPEISSPWKKFGNYQHAALTNEDWLRRNKFVIGWRI